MGSPRRSPPREAAERPTPLASETLAPAPGEELIPSFPPSPLRLTYYPENPSSSPPRDDSEKPPEKPVVESTLTIANLLAREDPTVGAAKKAAEIEGGGKRRWRPVPEAVRRKELRMAALALRVSAMVLSLISFSIMSADKTEGWAGDFFVRYDEYRYALVVNVMACAYSGFQVYAEAYSIITRRRIAGRWLGYYFDFTMDQILAYLSMSASSSAASRNDVWVSRFGGDDFTKLINASVAMSFLAFAALALSSVISAYNVFRGKS